LWIDFNKNGGKPQKTPKLWPSHHSYLCSISYGPLSSSFRDLVMSGSTPTLLPLCTGCLKPWTSSRYRTCDACRDRACAHRQARLPSQLPVRYDYPYWSIFSDFSQIMIHDLTTSYDDSNRIIVLSFRPFLFNPLSIQTERRCRFCSSCHVLN
jgi:hypothetical protein